MTASFASEPRSLDGIPASRFQIPPGTWTSVLEAMCACFPQIPAETWRERFARGRVLDGAGRPLSAGAPCRTGLELQYFREVPDESEPVVAERIVHLDAHLLVADKPHGMAVLPAGVHAAQTLLARLIRQTGNSQLVPIHRIDLETAGLVLFSVRADTRAQYHALFAQRAVRKHYEALAPALPGQVFPLLRESRLQRGEPFFRMAEVEGVANCITRIDVSERRGEIWRYALEPVTGRKHQLRVHMAAIGAAILNDPLYPVLRDPAEQVPGPLQLLARRIAFRDPIDGRDRLFESNQSLYLPADA